LVCFQPVSEFPIGDSDSDEPKLKGFHRSMSMGTNGTGWSRRNGDGKVVTLRRRNNSSGEVVTGRSTPVLPSTRLCRFYVQHNIFCKRASLNKGCLHIFTKTYNPILNPTHCNQFIKLHEIAFNVTVGLTVCLLQIADRICCATRRQLCKSLFPMSTKPPSSPPTALTSAWESTS